MRILRQYSQKVFETSILSADYYLEKCKGGWIKTSQELNRSMTKLKPKNGEFNFFMSGRDAAYVFTDTNIREAPGRVNLYLHFTDHIPEPHLMEKMRSKGFHIYSVNWLGDINICTPIPLGVPSKMHSAKSNKKAFMRELINRLNSQVDVKYEYYVNFDISTNLISRKPILETFYYDSRAYIPRQRLTAKEHYEAVSRSRFVISPPGAGPDCFRTWEALYLGAVPVVFRKNWPFQHLNIGARVIDKLEEVLTLDAPPSSINSPSSLSEKINQLHLEFG